MKYQPTYAEFEQAVPVWAEGREREMNLWLSFRAVVPACESATLRVTGSSAYNVKTDGEFLAFGPARAAHGFYRVDELPLPAGARVLTIDVAGYNANSFYHLDQPSFLCAELICDGKVVAVTGKTGFCCREMTEHEPKMFRFTFQRTFCEVMNLSPSLGAWENDVTLAEGAFSFVPLTKTEDKTFIARGCALNVYPRIPAEKVLSRETFRVEDRSKDFLYPYWIRSISPGSKHFEKDEITTDVFLAARNLTLTSTEADGGDADAISLAGGHAATVTFGREYTGKIAFDVACEEDTELLCVFDEFLGPNNLINFRRIAGSVLIWRLAKGTHRVSTFEPYSLSVLRLYALSGKATIRDLRMLYFGADKPSRRYVGSDAALAKIFDAAVETYRQNTFTLYMDCPSRERAGWLCDSFFTSRVEKTLTGGSEIERNFLENFFLPDRFENLPEGMFPMCYPADHATGNFIPNWAMFLVIELGEYLDRTGDRAFIDSAKPRIDALLAYFRARENADGLLEKLEKWVFVEWSKCNELTQDISFPTNMLYAKMLRTVASLYGDREAEQKAERLRVLINERAMTASGFYCDNAVYDTSGTAVLSSKCTETCQYYAFFCGIATPVSHPVLWKRLVEDFGPERVEEGKWPDLRADAKWQEIYPANAFIGNYLRLELLYRYGEHERLIDNIRGYFLKMAEMTGTLWENDLPSASCNHGFASHVLYWMDGLGMVK